jgi:predicted MFS family arabinose efflux permease
MAASSCKPFPVTSPALVPPPARELRNAALATAVVFAVSGGLFATWVSRLPAVRDRIEAGTAELGLALLCIGVGSLTCMAFTGRLCARYGSRAIVLATALPGCAMLAVLAYVPSVEVLAAALFLWGASYGAWDVAMNVHGSAVEQLADRAWMPRYHACWSIGGILGAGLGALAAGLSVPVAVHFGVIAVVFAVAIALATRRFIPDRATAEAPGTDRGDDAPARPRLLTGALVAVGLLTACATCIEGAAADWVALYLTDDRGAEPSAASGGYAVFAVAMAASRLSGTGIIERLGRVTAVRCAGVLTVAGIATTLTAPGLIGSYVGVLLWGMGVALVFPAAMSRAGEAPGRSADAIAAVSTIGYGGFLVGPPLVGILAAHVGLGDALWSLLVLALGIVALAGAAGSRRTTSAPPVAFPNR